MRQQRRWLFQLNTSNFSRANYHYDWYIFCGQVIFALSAAQPAPNLAFGTVSSAAKWVMVLTELGALRFYHHYLLTNGKNILWDNSTEPTVMGLQDNTPHIQRLDISRLS